MAEEKLFQWINDSEAFELMGSYHVNSLPLYEFRTRQEDFYITLLNQMFFILEDVKNGDYIAVESLLREIAKGLLIYSDNDTQQEFDGVDKEENHLYVAAIYYLIGYEAIASLLLRRKKCSNYGNEYAQLLCFLLKGGYNNDNEMLYRGLETPLKRFLNSGANGFLLYVIKKVEQRCESFRFNDLDEFFDCHILLHVLRKFSNNNLWKDLKKYDLGFSWGDYVRFSRSQGILQFLKSQRDAIDKGLLTFERSFSLKMPTSAGKSYITELLVYSELRKNPDAKVLYLAPLRSLSHELRQRYEEVGEALGFKCYAAYGGNSSTLNQSKLQAASLFITTPEFFSSMEGGDESILDEYTLVICDEGQLLDSVSRGIHYELLLSRIKKRGIARFLFISAIIPNIYEVNTWLGGSREQVGDSKYRPCEIRLAVAEKQNMNVCLNVYDNNYEQVKFSIPTFLDKSENKKAKIGNKITRACALALKASTAGSTLVFTYFKKRCQPVCEELLKLNAEHRYGEILVDASNEEDLMKLYEYVSYQYGEDYPLSKYIKHGMAYHNGALPQDVREYIEDYYRKRKIKLLVSNSTLAEGVNLPIRTLIVHSLANFDYNKNRTYLIDSTEIRNILGRVGRAGREKYGLVILPEYDQKQFKKVVTALKGDGIHEIRGIFFELIQQIKDYRRELTEQELNTVMEKLGASTAIDTMLLRNYGIGDEEKVVEDSISDSLAYHLSDDTAKAYIRKSYAVRYKKVSQNVDIENIGLLKQSGLDVDDFVELEKISLDDFDEKLHNKTVNDENWLGKIHSLIYGLPSMGRVLEEIKDAGEKENILDAGRWIVIVNKWMQGAQYCEIAERLAEPVDVIMGILNHIQYHFCIRLQQLIRYLEEKYGLDNDNLRLLPDYLRYGICEEEHAAMIKGGLTDRIALHIVGRYVLENRTDWNSYNGLRRALRANSSEVIVYLIGHGAPKLSIEKVKVWLGVK